MFPRVNNSRAGAHIKDGVLKLSRIGEIPVVMHRPIPEGFTLKQCTIIKKADGWYASFSMQDDSVPELLPVGSVKSAVGIDVGLEKFLTTSDGEAVAIPQFYRKAQDRLVQTQRVMSRRVKNSKNWEKAKNKVALLYLHLSRCRKEFHYQVAHWLCSKYDLIAHVGASLPTLGGIDLNIKGLARTKLAKSIHDAAWGSFLEILQAVATGRGLLIQKVNPRSTSIECFNCGSRVEKDLSERVHNCPSCGVKIDEVTAAPGACIQENCDRDWNSGINILNRALMAVGLPLNGCGKSVIDIEDQQVSFVRIKKPTS